MKSSSGSRWTRSLPEPIRGRRNRKAPTRIEPRIDSASPGFDQHALSLLGRELVIIGPLGPHRRVDGRLQRHVAGRRQLSGGSRSTTSFNVPTTNVRGLEMPAGPAAAHFVEPRRHRAGNRDRELIGNRPSDICRPATLTTFCTAVKPGCEKINVVASSRSVPASATSTVAPSFRRRERYSSAGPQHGIVGAGATTRNMHKQSHGDAHAMPRTDRRAMRGVRHGCESWHGTRCGMRGGKCQSH